MRTPPPNVREHPVLVVDDSETTRELLDTLLTGWSIPVVAVGTAEEALALLDQHNGTDGKDPFGLVIMDWMLPGMDGLEAAARIRARAETKSLPIVVISAYAGKEEEARCAEIGVNVFLPKPITASSLFDSLVEAQGAKVHAIRRALDVPLEREFVGRPGAAGRGQRGQPDGGARTALPAGDRAGHRRQRPGGRRHGAPQPGSLRRHPDGHADAGDGRAGGHPRAAGRPGFPATCPSSP